MASNRNRLKLHALTAWEGVEARLQTLPEEMRATPIAVIERSNDWGWLVLSAASEWAFLTQTGKLLPIPQQKIMHAAAAAGLELPQKVPGDPTEGP